ncbi:MAG: hypothetical protein DCC51_03665 [Anaerolineae bacterium]|nr:MAG: hypothetical protein DCC51_03665 [Anaerolineae bacterium]
MKLCGRYKRYANPPNAKQKFRGLRNDCPANQKLGQVDEDDQTNKRGECPLNTTARQTRNVIKYNCSAEYDNDGLKDIIDVA